MALPKILHQAPSGITNPTFPKYLLYFIPASSRAITQMLGFELLWICSHKLYQISLEMVGHPSPQ
jgi:hypothetical protein